MAEASVVHESEVPAQRLERPVATVRTLIGPETGSRHLLQRVFTVPIEASCRIGTIWADEVIYVAEGVGTLMYGTDREQFLEPRVAFRVPHHCPATAATTADVDMVLVSVVPPRPPGVGCQLPGWDGPIELIREDEREDLPAGDDRQFKLMAATDDLMQFVGFIGRSKAPPHVHMYEEAIYVLEGEGLVHIGNLDAKPIRGGTSIFLPPGTPHCLENRSDRTLKLLGVFSPPGSPAARLPGGDT
jgi:quercetin dioxygenase-like cupin family protein